jgi:DNA ligase-1
MEAFAKLLDSLSTSGGTLAKRRLMADYFKATLDPERGWALAALAGTLSFTTAKPNVIRELVRVELIPCCMRFPATMSATWPRPWRSSGRMIDGVTSRCA